MKYLYGIAFFIPIEVLAKKKSAWKICPFSEQLLSKDESEHQEAVVFSREKQQPPLMSEYMHKNIR